MTRITADVITATSAEIVRPFALMELQLDSGTTRVNNTDRDITWDGNVYAGIGSLGRVTQIQEGAELSAYGISMELTGIPGAYISMVLNENYQGKPCLIYIGFYDSNYAIVNDPFLAFSGRLDQSQITLGEKATVTLSAESLLVDWERARVSRFTDSEQRSMYPEDLGLEFVAQMVEKQIIWGKA
jgi:hypothetical protein